MAPEFHRYSNFVASPQPPAYSMRMVASLLNVLGNWDYLLTSPWVLAVVAFQLWMLVHAVRQQEWLWAVLIFLGSGLGAIIYYFLVYRAAPSATTGFELPGAHNRRRIQELKTQIYHLDKAHHHSQLADIYFQQGKLKEAEAGYRAALERDPQDQDTRAHLGQCLLRQQRAPEARPWLEGVVAQKPKHDYGHTLMALAETLTALGEIDAALNVWLQVTASHSYPRAKVQLAELYLRKKQPDLARTGLQEVIADDAHAPVFQRRRERLWVSRARSLLAQARQVRPGAWPDDGAGA